MEEYKEETLSLEERTVSPDYPGDLRFFNGFTPNGLYFYYMSRGTAYPDGISPGQAEEMLAIPPIDAIQSVTYNPYISVGDFHIRAVEFDSARFPMDNLTLPKSTMYRIEDQKNTKEYEMIGSKVTCYTPSKNIGGARNWRNEGKLYQFPYHYGVLYDGIIEPIEFKYHLCATNKPVVVINKPLTNFGTYGIYISDYKNDNLGFMEDNISTSSNQVPLISNTYTNFMSTNKAQIAAQKQSSIISGITSTIGAVAGGFSVGGPAGAAGFGAMAGANALAGIQGVKAQINDLKDAPNAIKSLGSQDFLYNKGKVSEKGLWHVKLRYTEEYMKQLGDYFAMYGYKQDKVMRPNLRSRYYYNYIKTVNCNISCKDGKAIPKEHFAKLRAIFDNGTTIYHIDRSGVHVGDMSMDNYEI